MFNDDLVDARSDYRKRQDRQRAKPRQMDLFSAQETVQIGVNPRPWLKGLPAPQMVLDIQDVRSDEEKERDWWRQAQQQIRPMFGDDIENNDHAPNGDGQLDATADVETTVVYAAPNLRQVGYRAAARRRSVPVRGRGNHSINPSIPTP